MVLVLEIICSANFAQCLSRLQIRQIRRVSFGFILVDRSFLRQHEDAIMAIRRFGMFVDNVIFRPVTSGDGSRRDNEREQDNQDSACKTHAGRLPG